MSARWVPHVLLAAGLVVAGCGGDGSASPEEDRELAERVLAALEGRLTDDGFSAAPDDDDEDDLEFESEECAELEAAFGNDEDLPGQTAEVETPSYERGELDAEGGIEETVEGSVTFVEDEAELERILDLLADERLDRCLQEAFEVAFAAQAEESGVPLELAGLEVESTASERGDGGREVRVGGELSAIGFTFPVEIELHAARVGRAGASIFVAAVGGDATVDAGALMDLLVEELESA